MNEGVIQDIISLREQCIVPVARQQQMELLDEADLRARPLVLLLGNHSSGKSSFINHLLDRDIQRTGVAPTDDGFTILLHDDQDRAIDGDALTSNPDLPFAELARFGPGLVQHLQGRAVSADLLRHVNLIDSPGMIDSAGKDSARPYDFGDAVRWFADKADLILMFFDPEKPGTTGETLSVLTENLVGIDHKLRIVMNKMDLFDGMRDFARTYGALCWNLSRSLKTKDMPHIYTTVLPNKVRDDCRLPLDGFAAALLELEAYIAQLPARRPDSVLSQVLDEGRQVLLRTRVTERYRAAVRSAWLRSLGTCLLVLIVCALAAWMAATQTGRLWQADDPGWWQAALGVLPFFGSLALMIWVPPWVRRSKEHRGIDELDSYFREEYRTELNVRERADDLDHDWQRARPGLHRILSAAGLRSLPKVGRGKIQRLKTALEKDLPRLRTQQEESADTAA